LASAATIWFLLPERTPPKAREPVKSNLKWYDRRILPFVIFAIGLSTARAVTNWGLGAAFACCLIFLLSGQFGPLVFALALSGLGFGLARPGFTSGASLSVAPHEQETVAGIIGGASE